MAFYLIQEFGDPRKAVVQRQTIGIEAKILVVLENGDQRLITFELSNEDCTVQDLLELANIFASQDPKVSLVLDPVLDINYIVELGPEAPNEDQFENEPTVTKTDLEEIIAINSAESFTYDHEDLLLAKKDVASEKYDLIQFDEVKTNAAKEFEIEPALVCENKKKFHSHGYEENGDESEETCQRNETLTEDRQQHRLDEYETLQLYVMETSKSKKREQKKTIHELSNVLHRKDELPSSDYQYLETLSMNISINSLRSDVMKSVNFDYFDHSSSILEYRENKILSRQHTSLAVGVTSMCTLLQFSKFLGFGVVITARPPREKPPWVPSMTPATICPY